MKRYLIIALAAVATLTACEDFLTRENPNKIESETYFTNESSLKIYTNGLGRSFATLILDFSLEQTPQCQLLPRQHAQGGRRA